MTARAPHIYLAGPEVFEPNAARIGAKKQALCRDYGFIGLFPLDAGLPLHATGPQTAQAIYRNNLALMRDADALIANLTPFRGPSADPGTVFELGWMIGQGRPAFGYSLDRRLFRDRTATLLPGGDGLTIEDFGLRDNLMIDCALMDGLAPMLDGFEPCLAAARSWFNSR